MFISSDHHFNHQNILKYSAEQRKCNDLEEMHEELISRHNSIVKPIEEAMLHIDDNETPVFFTSDTHWDHKNVITLCNRPFDDLDHMNNQLIENWNNTVPGHGVVFHLGDFSFSKKNERFKELANSLNGSTCLIPGNHDRIDLLRSSDLGERFHIMQRIEEVNILFEKRKHFFVLCHFAMKVWNKSHYNSKHLFGHSHGRISPTNQSLDVGVDSWEFRPVHVSELLVKMNEYPAHKF